MTRGLLVSLKKTRTSAWRWRLCLTKFDISLRDFLKQLAGVMHVWMDMRGRGNHRPSMEASGEGCKHATIEADPNGGGFVGVIEPTIDWPLKARWTGKTRWPINHCNSNTQIDQDIRMKLLRIKDTLNEIERQASTT